MSSEINFKKLILEMSLPALQEFISVIKQRDDVVFLDCLTAQDLEEMNAAMTKSNEENYDEPA